MEQMCVCILFLEKPEQTLECIRSFVPSGLRIYVLDNGSSKTATEYVTKECAGYENVTIYRSESNLGPSGGRNYLIKKTKEKWIFFADNDNVVKTSDWTDRLRRHIADNPGIEIFVCRRYAVHRKSYGSMGRIVIREGVLILDDITEGKTTNIFSGGISCISRTVFDRLGLFDEEMLMFEELEFCTRAILLKDPVRALLVDDIIIFHNHRIAVRENDRKFVMIRYARERFDSSILHFRQKHGLVWNPSYDWNEERMRAQLGSGSSVRKLLVAIRRFIS